MLAGLTMALRCVVASWAGLRHAHDSAGPHTVTLTSPCLPVPPTD